MTAPAEEARQVLENRVFKSEVDADWEQARHYGVTGVPTFIGGRYRVAGAQPYEVLAQLIQRAGERHG